MGLRPVVFAKAGDGEYAGNICWVVMFALLTSWVVAVVFTPYMGVTLLPDIGKVEGGHDHIYGTPNYQRLRRFIGSIVAGKKTVMIVVGGVFVVAILGLGLVHPQLFPSSDRSPVIANDQIPQ